MKTLIVVFLTICSFGMVIGVSAQIINVPKRVETKTVKRVNQNIDKGIDKSLDKVEDEVTGKNKKTEKDQTGTPETGRADQKKTGDNSSPESKSGNPQEQPSLQAFSKYDFVPGEKVLYYDDFSQDAVGDFPALWTTNAAGEINTLSIAPGNWLNLNSTDGSYYYLNNIDFPKNFIIEFDIVPKKTGGRIAAALILYAEDKPKEMDNSPRPGNSGIMISIEKERWNTLGYKTSENTPITGSSAVNPVETEKVNHVIIWVQNRRLRIYHKSAKVLDMPTNIYDGTKFNRFCFRLSRGASSGSYISNIRITDASPDMRNKLMTEGKLVTYGIYFDVNKDLIKPESYGTLKGIADILNEVPEVKVKILGFTDSDGADAANLDLSKRRAAAVKNELVKSFNVNGDRLVTDGLGEGQPVAPNDTPANKALNRRVEFIKM